MSVAVIVIAVQTKHAGILETIEKCFKYCAPKACKVVLRGDFVENIINKKSHELLVHFQNITCAHKSRNALTFMQFPILIIIIIIIISFV